MSDLNGNMLDTNVNSQSLTNLCKVLSLTQVIKSRAPTRITATSESLIGVILVSNPKLTKSSSVIKTLMGDHYPVFISLKRKVEKTRPQIITTRSYCNYTPALFAIEMAQHTCNLSTLLYPIPKQPIPIPNLNTPIPYKT